MAFVHWAAETTNYPREVCEMALAHTLGSKVEAAYNRGICWKREGGLCRSGAVFLIPATAVSTRRTGTIPR